MATPTESNLPDVTAALRLRSTLDDFNSNSKDRASLTAKDRATLATIGQQAEAFQVAYTASDDRERSQKAVGEVCRLTRRYVAAVTGTERLEVAGERIAVPTVESPAVRWHIFASGRAIIALIDAFAEARPAHLVADAKALREEDEAIDRVIASDPFAADLLSICDRLLFDDDTSDQRMNIGEITRVLQLRLRLRHAGYGDLVSSWPPAMRIQLARRRARLATKNRAA